MRYEAAFATDRHVLAEAAIFVCSGLSGGEVLVRIGENGDALAGRAAARAIATAEIACIVIFSLL